MNLTEIQANTFRGCDSLKSITIPESVKTVEYCAFYGISIKDVYYTGDIEAWCEIEFGDLQANLFVRAEKIYVGNKLIAEIEIPDTVTEIKDYAFYGFIDLWELSIGKNVTSIGAYAFADCILLQGINFAGTMEEWNAIPKDDTWNKGVGHLIEVVCSNGMVRC